MTHEATTRRRRSAAALHRSTVAVLPLEDRRMFAVNLGADGWTTFTPSSDSRIVYVSTSGNDNNSGLSESAPLRTFNEAKKMLRDGKPDWILMKRGDVFNDAFGSIKVSGRSMQEPIYFGAYGSGARPVIRVNGGDGIATIAGNSSPLNYLAVQGLYFQDPGHQGTERNTGIRLQRKGTGYYIEDVKIEKFKDGMVISGETANDRATNITIRRSTFVDSFSLDHQHAQGIYAGAPTQNLTIEENVLDHNGWNENVSGAVKTVYNHNIYINKGASGVVIRNNISTRGSLRGILSRGGGLITGNLTARNAIGIETWGDSTISNNVILENGDVPNFPQGFGIQVVENDGNATIADNVIAHDWSDFTYNVFGIRVWNRMDSATIRNNIIYDWRRPLFFDGGPQTALLVENNQFQIDDGVHAVVAHESARQPDQVYRNNKYYSPRNKPFYLGSSDKTFGEWTAGVQDSGSSLARQNYLDPNRTLGDYNQDVGGSNSFDAFINAARNMSRSNYNLNYTAAPAIAFIREGFNLGEITSAPIVSVQPSDGVAKEPVGATPADSGTFTITRTGSVTAGLTVDYALGGTAEYAVDYSTPTPPMGTLTFAPGQNSITVTITPLGDTTAENPETVDLRLLASGVTYQLGAPSQTTINIADGNGGTIPPSYGNPAGGTRGGGFVGYPYDPVQNGTGLKAEYYDNANFTDLKLVRKDLNVNFNYGSGSPISVPVNPDTFSVRWSGDIVPDQEHSQLVKFRVDADNAVRLFIDDILIIDTMTAGRFPGDANQDGVVNIGDFALLAANFNMEPRSWEHGDFDGDEIVGLGDFAALAANFNKTAPPPPSAEGTIILEANQRYSIVLEYVEYTGEARARLYWEAVGQNNEDIIATQYLFAPSDVSGFGADGAPLAAAPVTPKFSSTQIGEEEEESSVIS